MNKLCYFALLLLLSSLSWAEPIDLLPKGKSAVKCESASDIDAAITKLNSKLLEDKISISGVGGGEYFVKPPYEASSPTIVEKSLNGAKQFVACVTLNKK